MDSKIKKCPNCSQLFYLKISPVPKGNIPLFLTCGHSMCENCISNILKFLEPIECKICHQDMEINTSDITLLSQNKIKLYDMFPVNMCMLGELTLQAMESPHNKDDKDNEDPYLDLHAILKSVDDTQAKCLECHNPTSKMCQQCGIILCDPCFNKSHKNFIIFKNHILQEIETLSEVNTCKVHQDKPLEYYCKDCLKSICMDCLMVGGEKSCKNHNVVAMQEVNQDFFEELCGIAPKVDETFRRLTKTAVDIGNLLHNIDNETGSSSEFNSILVAVEQHFSRIFSLLQEHKKSVTSEINKLKDSERRSLIEAKNNVAESIKAARRVMKTINITSDKCKLKKINLSVLVEDAKKITETPWLLSHDKMSSNPLKVEVNEDICHKITEYVRLETKSSGLYKLRSATELGDDETLPPPPPVPVYPPKMPKDVRQTKKSKPKEDKDWAPKTPAFFKSAPKYHTKNSSHTSLNSIGSDSSCNSHNTQGDTYQRPVVQPVSPFTEIQHPKQLHEGSQEVIYVSHIVDPYNFYVQRACHQGLVKEMLKEFRNAISLPKPSLNHVAEGKVYLAFNKADNMWQRCRVVSIDRTDVNKPLFQVFCVDFGSTETVTIDKLRLLSPARLQSPYPLAIKCCLANCVPTNGAWNSDDSFLIQNIIDNKQAVIHVRKICSTNNFSVTLECDVTTFEDGISIAHALVFHGRAKMPNPKLKYPSVSDLIQKPKLFSSQNDFKYKGVEEVYISHVISPDKFFVRKRHLQDVYEKLTEDLEQEYSMSVNTGRIYLPEKGMVYAVNIEKCSLGAGAGAWARGVVEERPGRARVQLLLPDVGARVLVHWTALRHLHKRFTTLCALAAECHLAGVTPLHKMWSPGSVSLLQKYCGPLLELHVEDNSCGVTLYHHEDEESVCINTLMIKHKFAVSFGVFKFNKNDDTQDQVVTNKTPLDKPIPKPTTKKVTILQRNASKIKEKDLEAKDKGPLRLEAKVLHYQSPSLIYVSLVHQQKSFNVLYEQLQKYYTKNVAKGKAEWKVGDRCCAVCTQSKTWRRAVILELEGTNAKIFYTDFACLEILPIEKLKELTPDFESVGHAAIKCHLSSVRPAVGEEWPSLTKEYLSELLEAYKRVFITKSGNFKNQSMPIEVWVYHTVQGGALEPNKSEWRCLNKKIIDQGLGVPDKQEIPEPETNNEGDDELLSFLNITGSVREWLQLEPMPLKPIAACSNSDSNRSTPVGCDDNVDELSANSSDTIFISDWLPPEPLPTKEFTAMPTYIDNDGVIYLHDAAQQDTLDLIRRALDVRFKNPDPKAKYTKWKVGEPCIALFFLDNRFYRGRVLEVNKEKLTCLIHYIDYGNEECCSFANLRKSIALYQIPIQAHKCVLDRIRPVEKQWDRLALDYVHKTIVEKQCYVKTSGVEVEGLTPIELKYNKLWINDHLVELEMAVYTDGTKAVVRKFQPNEPRVKDNESVIIESDSGPDYIIEEDSSKALSTTQDSADNISLTGKDWNKVIEEEELNGKFAAFPKNDLHEFQCNINIINDINTLELSLIHTEETNLLYEEMFEQLQIQGEDLNPLNGIFENKACVALFQDDGQWYRASILQYSEAKHQIKVRYVDYGNIEVLSLTDVREIKEEWTELPPATISAKLHGIELNTEMEMAVIVQEFSETFLDKGPFNANIVSCEDIPNVVLHYENGELVYDKLIEKGIFIKI